MAAAGSPAQPRECAVTIDPREPRLASEPPGPDDTVEYCPVCRTRTWHVERVCEWADGHERMAEARLRNPRTTPE
jgi:hypothetical protein